MRALIAAHGPRLSSAKFGPLFFSSNGDVTCAALHYTTCTHTHTHTHKEGDKIMTGGQREWPTEIYVIRFSQLERKNRRRSSFRNFYSSCSSLIKRAGEAMFNKINLKESLRNLSSRHSKCCLSGFHFLSQTSLIPFASSINPKEMKGERRNWGSMIEARQTSVCASGRGA